MRFERKLVLLGLLVVFFTGCSQSPQAYMEKGKKAFEQKQYEVAILYFKNAMQKDPKNAEPYYQLGLSYLASGDLTSAASYLRKATELNPRHSGAQLKLSELMVASRSKDMVEEAQRRTHEILKTAPDDAEALNLLALTELSLGDPDSAEGHLKQVLQKTPRFLQSSVALAQSRMARKDVAGAEEALKQAVSQAPDSADPIVYLGGFYRALGRDADAEQQFRRALTVNPKHGPAMLALGALQVHAGQTAEAEATYRRLSALPEKQYKPFHALFLYQTGKRDQAIAEFERLAKEAPDDREARTRLVQAYLAVNRVPDAERVLSGALKKDPVDADALLQRSRIYIGSAKYTEAQADLDQVLRYRNGSAEAHYLLSKLRQARGEAAGRQQELGEALRLNPAFLAARLEMAQFLIAGRGAQSAIQLLDEAPEAQRSTVPVLVQKNWALLALGQPAEARKGVDRILAGGGVPDAVLQDAVLKFGQKDYAGARAGAEEVLKQNADDTRALNVLFQSYVAQRQAPAGLAKVREYASRQPVPASAQYFLGQLLMESSDRPGARRAFEAAKGANPRMIPADLSLAELDAIEGRRDEARRRISVVVAANPNSVAARLSLAQLDGADGQNAAAIEQYRKVLQLDSKNIGALNNLSYLLAEANQPDEALNFAQQAKEAAPDSPAIDDTLGWVYFRKGMYPSAVQCLESAVAKEGTARRRYHLAMAYFKAGNAVRGQQSLEAALRMDPRMPEAAEAQRMAGELAR